MTKIETAREAINSTIIPNGEKGITAQVLQNAFNATLEAIPEETEESEENTGDGALKFYIDLDGALSADMGVDLNSYEEWLVFKEEAQQQELPEAALTFIENIDAIFAHNAEVYQTILEKSRLGEGVSLIIDGSKHFKLFYDMMSMAPDFPETDVAISLVFPCMHMFMHIEIIGEMPEGQFVVVPIMPSSMDMMMLPQAAFFPNANGGFVVIAPDKLYIPEDGVVLNEEELTSNITYAQNFITGQGTPATYYIVSKESNTTTSSVTDFNFIKKECDDNNVYLSYFSGLTLKTITVNGTDGSVTITDVGSLTPIS